MPFRKMNLFVYIIMALAVFGIFYQLLFDTAQLFKYILMTVGFAAILFGIFYFFMKRRGLSGFSKQYRKAVKQSKRKYGNTSHNQRMYKATVRQQRNKSHQPGKPKATRSAAHLRVIDGKKDKKKNRASF
ncbi:hypothetical protein SAMN05421676_10682 [Salinibacillus kushneri]|uniref:Uncharacterized protein n=1 Tax=Salinibacillus kushneri TaxID=237682 RepID=A0A1I0FTP5_9BACI|nr:SA1362 family protein [Salinibacillus kushneri]SET61611.1 hypothetical protein SAMN05421676_10682 [Salinibacillus kushneri]